MKNIIWVAIIIVSSCSLQDEEAPGTLVPPTAREDSNLPQLTIQVAGKARALHLQTFGDPANPAMFLLHGGPGADFRLLLPLKALADKFYVVMWDSRGAGLSERVRKEELSIDSFDEEVQQVKAAISPAHKVTLVGHSFGANVFLRYTAQHPHDVDQLILIEPGAVRVDNGIKHNGGAISYLDGQDFFWQNEILTSKDHASADYKAIEVLPKSSRNWTCDDSIVENYPFWRFGAYHYHVVLGNIRNLKEGFDWARGIENFSGDIDIIAGSCGALGEHFQRKHNLPIIQFKNFEIIEGAGHLSLFTDFAEETINAVQRITK